MFITQRKLNKLVKDTLSEELGKITASYRREEVFVSQDQTLRYIRRYMSENLGPELRKITDNETFLDGIIERIKTKQL
jgi:hypothetical protein